MGVSDPATKFPFSPTALSGFVTAVHSTISPLATGSGHLNSSFTMTSVPLLSRSLALSDIPSAGSEPSTITGFVSPTSSSFAAFPPSGEVAPPVTYVSTTFALESEFAPTPAFAEAPFTAGTGSSTASGNTSSPPLPLVAMTVAIGFFEASPREYSTYMAATCSKVSLSPSFLVTMSRNIWMNAASVIADAAARSSAEGRPENQVLRVGGVPVLLALALVLFLDLFFVMVVYVRERQ
mmetsp:Transcript_3569/g.6627  ORF Transcript_3569/g.6627 Transcript_3569/m.6627 type:complete len:237 (-) Transcript_3569:294-1004(-)